jgi:hypothetical protein
MNDAAKYRANAELCRRMADEAQCEPDRRAWLEMAQSWSFLTKLEDVVPFEGFAVSRAGHDKSQLNQLIRDITLAAAGAVNSLRTMLDATLASVSRRLRRR